MTNRVRAILLSLAGAMAISAAQGFLLFATPDARRPHGLGSDHSAVLQIRLQSSRIARDLIPQSTLHAKRQVPASDAAADVAADTPDTPDAAPAPAAQRLAEGDPGRMNYFPAAMLTERPLAISDIDDALSARFAFIPPQSLAFTLLISEYGDVERVLVPDVPAPERLPAVLLDDLIQRFTGLRFLPGRLHGQAVPSALNIRVELSD